MIQVDPQSQEENVTPSSAEALGNDIREPRYIVGIGASAGGLNALERFFENVSPLANHAYVVIQHLSPDYKSLMAELLGKSTSMPVQEAEEDQLVQANQVYLIPAGKVMTIESGRLKLHPRPVDQAVILPIDIFFDSLAQDRQNRSIGVILSGNGRDGTLGMKSIHDNGGLLLAQDVEGAQFDGMPRSVIETGLVHFVGRPDDMPVAITQLIIPGYKEQLENEKLMVESTILSVDGEDRVALNEIYRRLQNHTGVDFAFYKQNTLVRRIERRMFQHQLSTMGSYATFLAESNDEIDILFHELLIGVTQFFRDKDAFEILKDSVIRPMVRNAVAEDSLRVWVPGCSTGEEAYSIAILFHEVMEELSKKVQVKIFATDIDDRAIEKASTGIFSKASLGDLSDERRRKYFDQRGEYFEIKRHIRELILFARQNLLKDPPFSRVDLITCRNVMIYFEPLLQVKAMATFRFSLKMGGWLFLGPSEMLDNDRGFETVNPKWRIFEYKNRRITRIEIARDMGRFEINTPPSVVIRPESSRAMMPESQRVRLETDNVLYRRIIEQMQTCTALVDRQRQLIHSFGDMSKFFNLPTSGRIDLDVVNLAHPNLALLLSTGIHKVFNDNQNNEAVSYRFVHIVDSLPERYNITLKPVRLEEENEKYVVITFEPSLSPDNAPDDRTLSTGDVTFHESASERISQLERELNYSQENLQATIEELETSNEELQATNEELLASNEELQSTNEELQSVNEELLTVNAEYQSKIRDLTELNNDISNIFNSTNVGIIFLDESLNIRKFTPTARLEINLIDQDIGRPLSHIAHNLIDCDLVVEAQTVLDTLKMREIEVTNSAGNWFMVRFIPYRTVENVMRGVLITLVDVTILKKVQRDLLEMAETARDDKDRFNQTLVNSKIAIAHQDESFKYTWVYNGSHNYLGNDPTSIIGKRDADLLSAEDAEKLMQVKRYVLENETGCRKRLSIRVDGVTHSYDLNVEPIMDDQQTVVGLSSVLILVEIEQ